MNFHRLLIVGIAIICTCCFHTQVNAQPKDGEIADKIIAVIGRNRIILQSDLAASLAQVQADDNLEINDSIKALVLKQMITQKMLVEQAERDSLLVSDEELEGTLDNRVRFYIRQYGSKERMEQVIGKTVYQLKDDYKDMVRENLMADKAQGKILANIKITPAEVQSYYEKLNKDSLPFFPAYIELAQIVIDPPTSAELDKYAYDKLSDIRKEIVTDGKSFELMAGIHSMDPGTRDEGGRMNAITRNSGLVPEFVTAAFRLQNGEISPIFKTAFGYHIVQMIQRKGEQADVRHILIMPQHTAADYEISMKRLDSVRSQIIAGKISFEEAVGKYSTDEQSKITGGNITDNTSGATQLSVDQLDPAIALSINDIKTGEISKPQMFKTQRGEQSSRIIFMKNKTEPHKANLKDDYNKIQDVALGQKRKDKLEQWVEAQLPSYYLFIAPEYASASHLLSQWIKRSNSSK